MLGELLTTDNIKLNVKARDWKDALKVGTDILKEKGMIEDEYLQAIYNNFDELGPYMVIAPGIVLSHARPEDGVNKLAMSLITLDEPINFNHETNDPVKIVITLAAVDNDSHLKALSQLMEFFMNSEDLYKIIDSNNKEEVLGIISKYSKNE